MHTNRRKKAKDTEAKIFGDIKAGLPIGIYGSFYNGKKEELLQLRDYLRDLGFKKTRISEDLDERPILDRHTPNPRYDRMLSKKLIDQSVAHIFVFLMPKDGDPVNLNQSVSMELERLITLIETGKKIDQDIMLLIEKGARDNIKDSLGGVCKGLIEEQKDNENPADIIDFKKLTPYFQAIFHYCCRCAEKKINPK